MRFSDISKSLPLKENEVIRKIFPCAIYFYKGVMLLDFSKFQLFQSVNFGRDLKETLYRNGTDAGESWLLKIM